MSTIAVVQARMGSSRFPNKVMQLIEGKPMIELLLARLSLSREIDRIVVATSDNPNNDGMVAHLIQRGHDVFQGSEDDVLDRFYQAVGNAREDDIIVRITGDCPLVDPQVVDDVVRLARDDLVDYASNVQPPTFPDGIDVEAFKYAALKATWQDARERPEREHVTLYTRQSGQFRTANFANGTDASGNRWTVDEVEDLAVVRSVFAHFHPRLDFSWTDVLKLSSARPDLFAANQKFKRNSGTEMGKGQKLWSRAKRVIPGGNMLLSKRSEMFLPDLWPSYFSRAKGCTVWDLDDNAYIDFSIMGVGTNILGYGHPEVDDAVRQTVDAGNMSTLNCPEEVYLAEKLVEMHPWADMARFARSGERPMP
ncbi:aminotransferase class III-fold pyridoxal phosphate-dependent enzyme [Devosia ginsengisoli]|uniref:aminotransferase class III-fold pyridoxal phosphate-dependent enzyme n=1 Tax=Devosia ginsengisoli TaxID=400770 RepID=UPI0026F21A92|nr:aminotransferase class III-fold pyridoxal phosphate-dependent enzyme [Devosia ginsengisoli]MCR6672045.1 aminotransferase class III-fold pyridoxal phosphate-dependent enzyme [Devosia ginsengisoli]